MWTSLLLSVGCITGVPLPEGAKKEDPKVLVVELFAKEQFYKEEESKEAEFDGILMKREGKGGPKIGIGRNNPIYLQMEKDSREVYLGGQPQKLDPYVGRKVKIIGKPMLVLKHREIWPASMLVYPDSQGDSKSLKIHATGAWTYGTADPDNPQKPLTRVFRSAAELITTPPFSNLDALPAVVEKMASDALAKALKVDAIDWSKQMLIVATAGTQSSGGFKVEILSVKENDKNLLVTWKVTPPDGFATNAFTHPGVVVLVDQNAKPAQFIEPGKVPPKKGPAIDESPANPADPSESPARSADQSDEKPVPEGPKIIARTSARLATTSLVIRSAEELAKLRGGKEEPDQASAEVAKMLKVEGIDWKKQMLITVSGGVQRTGGYSVEVKGLSVKDKNLIVNWKLNTPAPGSIVTQAFTHPSATILVDRFEGEVRFDPPPPKGKGKFERD